jgi:hypothetical protein
MCIVEELMQQLQLYSYLLVLHLVENSNSNGYVRHPLLLIKLTQLFVALSWVYLSTYTVVVMQTVKATTRKERASNE